MVEALDAAAAGAATPDALVVRAPERAHVHRRDVLYIPLDVPSAIPRAPHAAATWQAARADAWEK